MKKIGPNFTHAVRTFSGKVFLHIDDHDEPSHVVLKDGTVMQIWPEAKRIIHTGILRKINDFIKSEADLGKIAEIPDAN